VPFERLHFSQSSWNQGDDAIEFQSFLAMASDAPALISTPKLIADDLIIRTNTSLSLRFVLLEACQWLSLNAR
jgi:hypothetical protein